MESNDVAKVALSKIWGIFSAKSTWVAWPYYLAAKVRVRFMVMVWIEGGQGEVRGACAPRPPHTPQIAPPGSPTPTPTRPTCTPPQPALTEPPPQAPP